MRSTRATCENFVTEFRHSVKVMCNAVFTEVFASTVQTLFNLQFTYGILSVVKCK